VRIEVSEAVKQAAKGEGEGEKRRKKTEKKILCVSKVRKTSEEH
jgi:hypothetical protein